MRPTIIRFAKFGPQLKELRIHLCQTGEASKGVREYVMKQYPCLKKENPHLPILIRECNGTQPKLWARYGMGNESCVSLTNQTSEEIIQHIQTLGNKKC